MRIGEFLDAKIANYAVRKLDLSISQFGEDNLIIKALASLRIDDVYYFSRSELITRSFTTTPISYMRRASMAFASRRTPRSSIA